MSYYHERLRRNNSNNVLCTKCQTHGHSKEDCTSTSTIIPARSHCSRNNNINNIHWAQLSLSKVVSNDEEYDSEAINKLYDTLLQQSLQVYCESKKKKLKKKKPKIIRFNPNKPFDSINANIITCILNYLDLYSVIHFTQTCKKVAMANYSPYLLSSNFISLSDTNSIPNSFERTDNILQITQDIHMQNHGSFNVGDDIKMIDNNDNKRNPFSFLEPIDLTKVSFINPDTNDTIKPFAHLEINEEPELPEFDGEYVSNFINVDVNTIANEIDIDSDVKIDGRSDTNEIVTNNNVDHSNNIINNNISNNNNHNSYHSNTNDNNSYVIPHIMTEVDLKKSVNMEDKREKHPNNTLLRPSFAINIPYQLSRNN